MSGPPPDDLKAWSKNDLIRELRRLRAVMREHAERPGDDPRERQAPDAIVDVAGDPHAHGGALVDARSAVLMDGMEVVLIDTKQDAPVAMMMMLRGRVNYSRDRAEHAYLFGPDGAAALVTELMMLAGRAGAGGQPHGRAFAEQFRADLERRMAADDG